MAHDLEKKWRTEDVRLQENVDFSALILGKRVLFGLKKGGFKKPSPIQLEAIPLSKVGKDLLVQAKSGTGKTLVFVITALEILQHKLFRPQVLIVVPTREIATQICCVIKTVGSGFPKLTCSSFIGGLSVSDDIDKALSCQIVVGTPGRLNQLIREKALPTNSIRLLVFDEADQLLLMSFKEDINAIFNALPEDKQVIATSATYPEKLKKLLLKFLREPHIACLNSRQIALLGIIHYAKIVKSSPLPLIQYRIKLTALEEILKTVKFSQCLVFCNGIQRVEAIYKDIKKWGFSTTYISSAKEQCARLKAIDRLKHFKCKVLVSSDVTSRGIDAENVDLVINFDLAHGTETHMHRAGRAGRYGSVGVNVSIIVEKELLYFKKMEQEASFKTYKLPDPLPVDLIQKRIFGEYLIEEADTEDPDSDKESLIGDEVKVGVSVGVKDNGLDKLSEEVIDKNMNGINYDGTNYVLLNHINTEENAENGTAVHCPSMSEADIPHLISNGTTENNCCSMDTEINNQVIFQKESAENAVTHEKSSDLNTEGVCQSFEAIESNLKMESENANKISSIDDSSVSANQFSTEKTMSVTKEDIVLQSLLSKNGVVCSEDISMCVEADTSPLIAEGVRGNIHENLTHSGVKDVHQSFEALSNIKEQPDLNGETMTDEKISENIDKEYANNSLEENENDVKYIDENCESIFLSNECLEKSAGNVDLKDILESDIYVKDNLDEDDLNNVIKTFLKEYESEKDVKTPVMTGEDERETKTISVCAINNLNSKKYTYMYEVFKKYQNEMDDKGSGENANETSFVSLQDKVFEQSTKSSDVMNCNLPTETNTYCKSYSSNEQNDMNQVEETKNSQISSIKLKGNCSKLACNDDTGSVVKKPEPQTLQGTSKAESIKPLHAESKTLNPVDKSEFEADASYGSRHAIKDCDKSSDNLAKESTPVKDGFNLSEEMSESSSDDSTTSNKDAVSSDSEFDSQELKSDISESESSSSSSLSEGSYHHNQFRTGKQNPSLVSNSSSSDNSERRSKTKYKPATSSKHSCNCGARHFLPTHCSHRKTSLASNHSSFNDSKRRRGTKHHQNVALSSSCSHYDGVGSFPRFHHCSYWGNCPQHPSRRGRCYATIQEPFCGVHRHTGHSTCSQQHCDQNCFRFSGHSRCPWNSFCNQMPVCSHWYDTFYNQCRHLQNCVRSARM